MIQGFCEKTVGLKRALLHLSGPKAKNNRYRLYNVLCWLWNIYEGAELLSVYFIINTKHCISIGYSMFCVGYGIYTREQSSRVNIS